jgi:hypothetical protein
VGSKKPVGGLVVGKNSPYGNLYIRSIQNLTEKDEIRRPFFFPGSPYFDTAIRGGRVESYFQRIFGYPGDHILGFQYLQNGHIKDADPLEVQIFRRKNRFSQPIHELNLRTFNIPRKFLLVELYFCINNISKILSWLETETSSLLGGKIEITNDKLCFKGIYLGSYFNFKKIKFPKYIDTNIRPATYLEMLNFIDEKEPIGHRVFNRSLRWNKDEIQKLTKHIKLAVANLPLKLTFWLLKEEKRTIRFLTIIENLNIQSSYDDDRIKGFIQRTKIFFSRKIKQN